MSCLASSDRHERATAFLPQKLGLQLAGVVTDGYWIDEHLYFFCVSEIRDGRQHTVPSIVRAQDGSTETVVSPETLTALLSSHGEKPVSAIDMARAQYDMLDPDTLVVTMGLVAYHVALAKPTLAKVETLDPTVALHAPDGRHACFLNGDDIWVKDRTSGISEALTFDGAPHYRYATSPESGTAPLAAQRSPIPVGLWSRDSEWFVTHRIDERALPEGGLVEHAPAGAGCPVLHRFKVAGPDVEPPKAEYIAFHLPTGRTVRATYRAVIAAVFSPFLIRQCWLTDIACYFFDWDRFCSAVSLVAMDLATGMTRTVLSETAEDGWIDAHPMIVGQPMVRPLEASGEIIWYSHCDGSGHLYLHDLATGALRNPITQGRWSVRDIIHVDETTRRILFLASGFEDQADPGHRRLCAVGFDGSGFETVFAAEGDLSVRTDPVSGVDQYRPFRPSYAPSGVSPDGRFVAASLGSANTPTRSLLIDVTTGIKVDLATTNIHALWQAPTPQPFEVVAADGVTRLVGTMYLPSDFDPEKSYPLVDYIYPGPQLNWLTRRFPNAPGMTLQSVAELGMVGIILETRGMPNRDRAFHQAGRGRLSEPQLADHAAAIEQLCERHAFLDRNRIGIFGQSGGGYATARALFDYPALFKVGVSVCGNHDSRNYVGYWIDKYGGRPGTAERDKQSNSSAAGRLEGKLLLMHGDMDDNVHPGHTLALSAALIAAGKDFDQLIVPGATHSMLTESPYAVQRLWAYLERHLLGSELPAGFRLTWSTEGIAAAKGILARDLV